MISLKVLLGVLNLIYFIESVEILFDLIESLGKINILIC